jgi:hypothetical protein
MAYSKHGSTIVPTCKECNLSKWKKGFKEWLWWLIYNLPDKWQEIVEYNKRKRNPIAQKIREVRYQLI